MVYHNAADSASPRSLPIYARWPCTAALETLCRVLLAAIAQHRVGDRPGRLEPRRKKRRAKPYPLLNQPRAKARKAEVNGT
jgi:hypothetical protein